MAEPRTNEVARQIMELKAVVIRLESKLDERDDDTISRELFEARFAHLEERLEARSATNNAQIETLQTRLNILANWQQWAVRLIIGTLITVLLSSIIGALIRIGGG